MTTALTIKRCGCGEPLYFGVRCPACARSGFGCYICGRPALGQSVCGDECREIALWLWTHRSTHRLELDDDSEARHFEQVDNEADLKDEGQHIDPSKTF